MSGLISGLARRLSLSGGAKIVGWISTAAGAVQRSVQVKLESVLIDRADFVTVAQFNAATAQLPQVPSLDNEGNFGAKITPSGEPTRIDLKKAVLPVATGPRDSVLYAAATAVTVSSRFVVMGGFRYRGKYSRGRAPSFAMPASATASVAAAGLGAETAFCPENWYAIFAVAADASAEAQIKTMPFLRVMSVAGNVVSLNKAGEGVHAPVGQNYSWKAADNMAGVECLVISENGGWSGRVTTITGNGAGYVALANVGVLAFGDFLLPAPPGWAHFCYMASFYMDTQEVRNIYDSGSLVRAKMIPLLKAKTLGGVVVDYHTGAFPVGSGSLMMQCAGYISPLATAVVITSQANLQTEVTGDVAEYFDPDGGGHIVDSFYRVKGATAETYVFPPAHVPFMYHQLFNWSTGGARAVDRTGGALQVTGWIEP